MSASPLKIKSKEMCQVFSRACKPIQDAQRWSNKKCMRTKASSERNQSELFVHGLVRYEFHFEHERGIRRDQLNFLRIIHRPTKL